MRRKKKAPNGKHAVPERKADAAPDQDPEWDILEERFASVRPDFSKLAELVQKA